MSRGDTALLVVDVQERLLPAIAGGPRIVWNIRRLLDAAKVVDNLLAVCRRVYGMEPCGEHWMYGPLRVEDWRAYTAIHIRHHLKQLKVAVNYARNPPPEPEQVTPFPRVVQRIKKQKI